MSSKPSPSNPTHGAKRKRSGPRKEVQPPRASLILVRALMQVCVKEGAVDAEDELKQKITGKLHHWVKEVKKAGKKAKTFEIQRLVKKLKELRKEGASKKGESVEDVEAQLEYLKHLDHEPLASTAFYTKIRKDKALFANQHVVDAVAKELSVPPATASGDSAKAKVESRLLSSKQLAIEVQSAIGALRLLVNPPARDEGGTKAEQEGHELKGKSIELKAKKEKKEKVGRAVETKQKAPKAPAPADEEENEDDQGAGDGDGWESGSVDDVEAGSNEEASNDGWQSGSIHEHEDSDAPDPSDDSDDEEDEEASSSRPSPPPAKRPKTKAPAEIKSSTFLPSLNVGFTRGDSDSDWSDGEADAADVPRKNRRGQRARKAIWEKKYGKNANHVKKQREEDAAAAAAKAARGRGRARGGSTAGAGSAGGAFRGRGRGKPFAPPDAQDGGWAGRDSRDNSGPTPTPAGNPTLSRQKREAADDKPLHPSWEAKRKLKERENKIVPSQGKKIVFS
ncbi:hypothetical protein BOTBODRAFT_178610 [Botryobasidium botryosum FD-172 SS1]|uniref:Bud22 domain-containing protein n=1 Tax=Botryobasidium botryosum (strain FD-172 SS1) TaxID=930990 RepID=A0A067M296_BOTB1|nr:hypothetical protein BOTBODRAFT_178610 [Botryobasidium botryosum FD-172 SS1]